MPPHKSGFCSISRNTWPTVAKDTSVHFLRLSGCWIKTNIRTGDIYQTRIFGLIEEVDLKRKYGWDGRLQHVEITLSKWKIDMAKAEKDWRDWMGKRPPPNQPGRFLPEIFGRMDRMKPLWRCGSNYPLRNSTCPSTCVQRGKLNFRILHLYRLCLESLTLLYNMLSPHAWRRVEINLPL